jgi:hypothetical protein
MQRFAGLSSWFPFSASVCFNQRVLHFRPVGSSFPSRKGPIMNRCLLGISFFACLLLPSVVSGDQRPDNLLLVANQMEHSVVLVDPVSKQVLATVGVDINGHEVAVSPDGRFGYVPIYGNTWVGKPGSNGSTIHVVDLHRARSVAVIDLGKEVRPHCLSI